MLTLLLIALLDARVAAALDHWRVPGAAVVVVTPDRVFYLKGHGKRQFDKPDPVTPDTLFPLASCTKAFTTALVTRLADEGKLSWDDPVRKHLPMFRLSDPAADALVTLRDLASHRTGVDSHDLLWYRAPWSQAEMVQRAGKLPVVGFRTDMKYQSVMYVALGQAAAAAGGKPWEVLVREHLTTPLGMKGVCFTTLEAVRQGDRATGHRLGDGDQLATVPPYEQPEPNPAGSMHASARDLAAWLQWQLKDAKARETHRPHTIIKREGSAAAYNPETHQLSYALGWVTQDYRGRELVQHAGLIDGTRVHLTLLPKDGYALAILANRDATRMNLALSNTLVDTLLGLSAKDWHRIVGDAAEAEEADRRARRRREDLARRPDDAPTLTDRHYAGEYEDPAYGVVKVTHSAKGFAWEWGNWKLVLEHHGGDTFRLRSDDPRVDGAFVRFRIEEGKVATFDFLGQRFRKK